MNKDIALLPVLWLLTSNVFAQAGRGAIGGTVVDPDGNPVAGATVKVKLMPAVAAGGAVSAAKGDFTISGLAAGDYELSIPPIGFTFRPYSRSGLMVRAGETLRTDIRLQWNLNLGTIGDDYYLDVRNRYAGINGPAPRTADGKPDLSGVWQGSPDMSAERPSPLEWAATIARKNVENSLCDSATALCLAGRVVPHQTILYYLVQISALIVRLFKLYSSNR